MAAPYNKKNMEDASSGFQMSAGQKNFEKGVSDAWNSVKGLVGAGEDDDSMGEALKRKKKKLDNE